MKIILGLGNPGEKYSFNRHNFGFYVAERFRMEHDFPEFKFDKKFRAEISIAEVSDEKVAVVRPQTFMNLSGEAARAVLDFFKILPADVLVVFDDVDLDFGTIRFRHDGGSGGHNGVKNLITHLGTQNFPRLKLGVRNEFLRAQIPTEKFVLSDFSAEEKKELSVIEKRASDSIAEFLIHGLEAAMTRFN